MQGDRVTAPANNFFEPVLDQSEKAWSTTVNAFKKSEQEWVVFLEQMDEEPLDKIYPNNNASYYKNIHGIIQNDAYHPRQIVMLKKAVDN